MKNIFSNFGTKKVAGVILAGATLVVGLGVVSNFSGSSQKAANEAALARFGDSSYNNSAGGSSASRADLERQMSATQGGYSARFLTGKSDGTEPADAFSSDGAYTEGVRSYGSVNGEYQPFNSTYEQGVGGVEFEAGSGNSGYGQAQFQSVQDAASAAAGDGVKGKAGKGTKGQSSIQTGRVKPATEIKKLGVSKGNQSFNGSTGGGIRNGSGSYGSNNTATGGNDSNSVALPQARTGQADGNSFKLGRADGMSGFNVGFSGSEYKSGRAKGIGAASDFQIAMAYSGKAVATRQEAGAKALADAAFDGSNPENLTPTIPEGASIDKVASSLMKGLNIDMPEGNSLVPDDLENDLKEIAEQTAALTALQKKIKNRLWTLVGVTLAAALLLFAFTKAFYNGVVWAGWAALALSAVTLSYIYIMVHGLGHGFSSPGDDSIIGLIRQMGDNEKFGLVNEGLDIAGKESNVKTLSLGLVGLLGLCWVPWGNVTTKIGKFLATDFGKFVGSSVGSEVLGTVKSGAKDINQF
ncbi:MAG: hypothetical protein J5601_03505 [Elusimicrobiaceae bacterium]|nr:hypothetical protein [Elusimicrobiaceae bacterium]